MTANWINDDINKILIQLDKQNLPFKKYTLLAEDGKSVNCIGGGGSAKVYQARKRRNKNPGYVIKVIGFGDEYVDSSFFSDLTKINDALYLNDHVVRVYDSKECLIWIEGDNKVVRAEKAKDNAIINDMPGNCLRLQFIVMEELEPIVKNSHSGKALYPQKLASFDEQEIINLAIDIGEALSKAHEGNIIHRDIKLENIMYDPQKENYKLGDFGISKVTSNGLASTRAYTYGYGAPEVVTGDEEKYDKTVDIYSLGMVLYVLLNDLKFPGEENKNQKTLIQYKSGFEPKLPKRGTSDLQRIVSKMIKYNPDDRYQTMEAVLDDLLELKNGKLYKKKKKNRITTLLTFITFWSIGSFLFAISFPEAKNLYFTSRLECLFWLLCIWKGYINIAKVRSWEEYSGALALGLLALSIWYIYSTGFTLWKLIFAIIIVMWGTFDLCAGIIFLVANCTQLILQYDLQYEMIEVNQNAKWITLLLLSLAVYLLMDLRYEASEHSIFVGKWNVVESLASLEFIVFYIFLIRNALIIQNYQKFFAEYGINDLNTITYVLKQNHAYKYFTVFMLNKPIYIGIAGIVFCILWKVLGILSIRKKRDE